MRKIFNSDYLYFGIFLLILFFVFRSLIFNFSKNLIDNLDYPFIVWTIYQNVQKITSFDILNFFNTNAFYPNKSTLLFSDILLPQSLIALPFALFIKNFIIVGNIVFIITFCLNYFSVYIFWFEIFKNKITAFFGSIMIIFSPILVVQLGHFQMQSYWPFFFCLYFIFKNKKRNKNINLVYASVFLSLQFLSSVYLSIFLLTAISLFYAIKMICNGNRLKVFFQYLIMIVIFGLSNLIFIKNYIDVKNKYEVKRNIEEFVSLSAHVTDYLFTTYSSSLTSRLGFVQHWNTLDQHFGGERAMFPGILVVILFIVGLIKVKRSGRSMDLEIHLNYRDSFFLILFIIGFIFSLGPRVNFNGHYDGIPTGYNFLLNNFHLLESVRAVARWSFLFYIGVIYFALKCLNKYVSKKLLVLFFFLIYCMELLPLNIVTKKVVYIDTNYIFLKNVCMSEKKVVLEYPVTHLDSRGGVGDRLGYISTMLLSSLYDNCYLINGYSGVDLAYLRELEINLGRDMMAGNIQHLNEQLKKYKVNILKVNLKNIKDDKEVMKWENLDLNKISSKVLISY